MKKFLFIIVAALGFAQVSHAQETPIFGLLLNDETFIFAMEEGTDYSSPNLSSFLMTPGSVRSANIIIAPNPTDGLVTVTSTQIITVVQVYKPTGAVIIQHEPNSTSCTVNMENLDEGDYIIMVRHYSSTYSEKIKKLKKK